MIDLTNMSKLLNDLVVGQYKMRLLHWNVSGAHFNSVHLLFGDYISAIDKDIDTVAEMILSLGGTVPSFEECTDNFEVTISASELITSEEAYIKMMAIFNKFIKDISEARADNIPESFKSKLDELHYYYSIENCYKNIRRLKK